MFFYEIYRGQGRDRLIEDLGPTPFALSETAIVEAVSANGCVPDVASPRRENFRTVGQVSEVVSDGLTYFVAVDPDSQEISVQEARATDYDSVE